MKVSTRVVRLLSCHSLGLAEGKIFDALLSLESVADVKDFTSIIDPLECVSTIAMHVTIALRRTPISIHYRKSMHRFRHLTEKVPLRVGIKDILGRVLLESMEEIWCHHWISDEENREVNTHHVIVSLLGIELESETTDIPQKIRGTS